MNKLSDIDPQDSDTRQAEPSSVDSTIPTVAAYPLVSLTEGVVLPDMVVTITVATPEARSAAAAADPANGGSDLLILAPAGRAVGVLAKIENRHDDTLTIRARQRVRLGAGVTSPGGSPAGDTLLIEGHPIAELADAPEVPALAQEYRALAEALLTRIGGRRMAMILRELNNPGALADSIAYWPELTHEQRVEVLETPTVPERLRLGIGWLRDALADLEVRDQIASEVTSDLDDAQRKAILRRQLAAIRKELGEDSSGAAGDYGERLDALDLPDKVRTAIEEEIDRMARTSEESMEASWLRTWLDVSLGLPWNRRTIDNLDLVDAKATLDRDHTGLDDVKDRLIEFLAVRKLREQRGHTTDRRAGVLLALVGPPGVGKTSLGESVASALGRSFVRVALGGIRDEAEIRGHRRTYVGARPGRVVRAIQEAGTMNPVVLLDEIDKIGNGWQGDPTAALLEVLDPAQNKSFRDHYLEFEFDLSEAIFIATANTLDTIPGPLLDRLEVINLDGYTEREKTTIARDHLLPKLLERNGLTADDVTFTEEALASISGDYATGLGVRRLERLIDRALRKIAARLAGATPAMTPIEVDLDSLTELLGPNRPREYVADRIDRPGIVAGLAVTGSGGDVLYVEAALVPGDGEPTVTGQLGDVMQESVKIAQSVVAGRGLVVPAGHRLHVHFPAGAVPKDGPSAGVTLVTALTSLLSDTPARPSVAMTGEMTLHGRVLPIGGVKQKLLAAHRGGVREVLIPKANAADLDDVPSEVLEDLTVHLVENAGQVIALALV